MDAENPTSLRRLLLRAAATLLALLLLYPLSVGPAAYLMAKLRVHPPLLYRFYAPLAWAINGTPLLKLGNDYIEWWLELAVEQQAR